MAEALLRKATSERGDIEVGSAGVAAMPGQPASHETILALKHRETTLDGFRSRQVDENLLSKADLIVAMTDSHASVVRDCFPDCPGRIKLLCDFIDEQEGLNGADVPDPIGMGREAYEEVAEVIELALPGIIRELAQ